jgi:hypothetical protein
MALNHLQRDAVRAGQAGIRDWRGAYIAPFRIQAKIIAWDYAKYYSSTIPGVVYNESELRIDYPWGARIRLMGADNPNSLRGPYLDAAVFDEFAQIDESAWKTVIRPALVDRKGWAIFIGTPSGHDHFYDLHQRAKDFPDWGTEVLKASQTGVLDAEELAKTKAEMSEEEYEQEFECSFEAAVRGAYYGKLMAEAEEAGRITSVPYDSALPVHTAWDLGMDDSTTIWFLQTPRGGETRAIDYYEHDGQGLAHYAHVLQTRGYVYGQHHAPHDIQVRELGTGKSRLEVARELGIRFTVAPMLAVQDGIDSVRRLIPRLWFDRTRCAAGIEKLRLYKREYSDRLSKFRDQPLHDWTSHAADALRTFAVAYRDKFKDKPKSGRRLIASNSDQGAAWMGA